VSVLAEVGHRGSWRMQGRGILFSFCFQDHQGIAEEFGCQEAGKRGMI
jgi:hypothetical protein